ncbi:MAG: hypothetical protein JKY57_01090 [Kordiimonadaceae bacterium]|nr:hypothetical protein [Kordiimonadaceae bacterium]
MTAATFGRPVVVPHSLEAITAEIAGQSVSYNIDNIEDCVRACTQAVHISEIADTETVLRNWATKLSPAKVSAQFFEALRERL